MKVLITGANGMVARAAIERCRDLGDDVFAFTRQELDISDAGAVGKVFADLRPDAVLNTAAYTNVDGAESNRDACFAANATGPENLARAAVEIGARFVTISTDYVFDGSKGDVYFEDDLPKPQSVYAESKYEGERLVAAANPDAVIVRSGWIYGDHGTNFLSVMPKLLSQGKTIKAIEDSFGTPTFAEDLARRLRELAATDAVGIFHITNSGEGCSYYQFAQAVADIGGFDRSLIEPVLNAALTRPAMRPADSRLGSKRIEELKLEPLREWRETLEAFMA